MTFKEDGYEVIKNFISTTKLYEIAVSYADKHSGVFEHQSPNSPSYINKLKEFKILHKRFIKKIGDIIGLKLFKTYFYWRMYYNEATLDSHTDRAACEISVTLFLGGDTWDIYVVDKSGKTIKIKQKPGDILLYRGCELEHGREQFNGEQHAQIFFHYVDQNGPKAWAKDDIKRE